MPINSIQQRGGGMPKIGQLRKGAPKATNAPGRNLPYFRFVSSFPEVTAVFENQYGKEPVKIEAIIPAQLDEAWDYWMETWKGGGLVRRCNQTCMTLQLVNGRYQAGEFPCFCAANPNARKEDLCKPAGRLKLFLPKLERWGYVELVTGAWWDVVEVTESLKDVEDRAGQLIGMPIIVQRVQKEVSHTDKDGKRTRNKQWVIHVEAHPSFVAERLLAWQSRTALPAGDIQPDEEDDDTIAGEFIDGETGEFVTADQSDEYLNNHLFGDATAVTEPGPEPEPEPPAETGVQDTHTPQWVEFHKLGGWLYANRWNMFRPKVVAGVTKKKKTSSKDLTPDELLSAIDLMGKKIGKLATSKNAMTAHLVELANNTVGVTDAGQFIDVVLAQTGEDYKPVPTITSFCSLLDHDDMDRAMQVYQAAADKVDA